MNLTAALSAVGASFLASLVEVVEAFTIILAVAAVRGPRPAALGALAGFAALALLVLLLGPLFQFIPLHALQIVIGLALLLFGMRWLRKAILRSAGLIALHDEEKAFVKEREALQAEAKARADRADFMAGLAAFKAVLLEGVEVVFIVLAVGGGRGLIGAASLGALAAAVLVGVAGVALRKPLSAVPENALKTVVGVMLSAFGTFWIGEGLGAAWPGEDLSLLALVIGFGVVAWLGAKLVAAQRATKLAAT